MLYYFLRNNHLHLISTLCGDQITFKNNIKFFGRCFVTMFSNTMKPVLNKANISLGKHTIYASVTIFSSVLLCIKSAFLQYKAGTQ